MHLGDYLENTSLAWGTHSRTPSHYDPAVTTGESEEESEENHNRTSNAADETSELKTRVLIKRKRNLLIRRNQKIPIQKSDPSQRSWRCTIHNQRPKVG